MNNLLAGTKKILGAQYKRFCEAMTEAAENDDLPMSIQIDDTFGMTCQDIGDLCYDFEKDTQLELTACFFICRDCKKLHVKFEIDSTKEEEEEDTKYLQ